MVKKERRVGDGGTMQRADNNERVRGGRRWLRRRGG